MKGVCPHASKSPIHQKARHKEGKQFPYPSALILLPVSLSNGKLGSITGKEVCASYVKKCT